MRILGKLYIVLVLVLLAVVSWKLVNDKLIAREPEYQALPLLVPVESPVWLGEAANFEENLSELEASLSAQAYLVLDVDSRTVIAEKNAKLSLPPASTTKLMTALTALELYDLNDMVTVSEQAAEDNDGGGLFGQEQMTVRNLLAATLVSSANDAATALAEHYPGGEPAFIVEMNSRAERWSLESTHFENPTGYDEPPNISTARDLSVLVLQAIENPMLLEWLSTPRVVLYNSASTIRHILLNTNDLLGVDPRIIGGKTGTTALAKEVLVSLAQQDGHTLIVIVMNTNDRYRDTQLILNWLAQHVGWQARQEVLP